MWACSSTVCLWEGRVCSLYRNYWSCPRKVSLFCRKKGLGPSQNLCFGLWAVMEALCHGDVSCWEWALLWLLSGPGMVILEVRVPLPWCLSLSLAGSGLQGSVFSMQGWWMMLENILLCQGGRGQPRAPAAATRIQPQLGAWDAPVGSAVVGGSVLAWHHVVAALVGLSLRPLHKNRAWGAATRAPRARSRRGLPGKALTSRSIWEGASRTMQIPAWREAEIVPCIARFFFFK